MPFSKNMWENPENKYRVNPMMHNWPKENRTVLMDAIKDFGFGGVVTNPDQDTWYDGFEESCKRFGETISELEKRDLLFWIYDEKGYPSGFAGGETLKGHKELEAKGLYMYRVATYEDRHFTYHIDDDSDKIVWAATYPLDTPGKHQSYVMWDKMTPVEFEERKLECDLKAESVLYIFNVRAAHIGSQATHNTCTFEPYINIMNPDAVKRFIDVAYEPIARECPEAFAKSVAVFTDEPSLMANYARDYETWNFALVPWVDGMFEYYEEEYGQSILPHLPLLFEGRTEGYPVRVKFYRLVGKLVRKAYSEQLQNYCASHGATFSGHYLCEELMTCHADAYGSYIEVVSGAGYPGLDVLCCYPEIYSYNTAKYPQMVMRKKGTNGMMVEICPFCNVPEFAKDPVENMSGIMGIIYMSGVRITNSYFSSNFVEYNPEKLCGIGGYMHRNDAISFNSYVGRMGYMLDNLTNDTNTFVYYGIEDTYAKKKPRYTGGGGEELAADSSVNSITNKIYEAGHDFYYADRDDFAAAAKCEGKPYISGHEVKTVIVPSLDVMYDDAYSSIKALADKGVKVFFVNKIPNCGTEKMTGYRDTKNPESLALLSPDERNSRLDFTPVTENEILRYLEETDSDFTAKAETTMLLKARFVKDNREMWMVDNNSRHNADVTFDHKNKKTAAVYNPVDGSITKINMGDCYNIPSFRAVFVWFD